MGNGNTDGPFTTATDRQPIIYCLTLFAAPTIVGCMDSLEQAAKDLDRLEQQLKGLLDQCRKLREENQSLQNRQESLVTERAGLVAKNEEARTKVEAMINRLKALEQP
jgi:cell division protein ZapB